MSLLFCSPTDPNDLNQLRQESKNYFRYHVDQLPNHKVLLNSP